jgi:hypothetical protein
MGLCSRIRALRFDRFNIIKLFRSSWLLPLPARCIVLVPSAALIKIADPLIMLRRDWTTRCPLAQPFAILHERSPWLGRQQLQAGLAPPLALSGR